MKNTVFTLILILSFSIPAFSADVPQKYHIQNLQPRFNSKGLPKKKDLIGTWNLILINDLEFPNNGDTVEHIRYPDGGFKNVNNGKEELLHWRITPSRDPNVDIDVEIDGGDPDIGKPDFVIPVKLKGEYFEFPLTQGSTTTNFQCRLTEVNDLTCVDQVTIRLGEISTSVIILRKAH